MNNTCRYSICVVLISIVFLFLVASSEVANADVLYLENGNLLEGMIIELNEKIVILQTPFGILELPQSDIKAFEKNDYSIIKIKAYPSSQKIGLWVPLESDGVGSIVLEISHFVDEKEVSEYIRLYLAKGDHLIDLANKTNDNLMVRLNMLKAINCYEIVRNISLDHEVKWNAQKKINKAKSHISKQLKLPEIDNGYDSHQIISEILSGSEHNRKVYAKKYINMAQKLESKASNDSQDVLIYLRPATGCYYIAYKLYLDTTHSLKAYKGYKRCSLKMLQAD